MTDRVPAWTLAVAAMLSVQLGAALSTRLFAEIGPAGTAWLRLAAGATIFLAMSRPDLRGMTWKDWRTPIALGVATGVLTTAFLSAIDRIPLGTAVAIEFLGPLTVAAVRSHDRRSLVWPALALVGVLMLTEPWHGAIDPVGVAFACLSGLMWATYIVLTQKVGDRFAGLDGLSITIPIAAVTAAFLGVPQAWGHLTWSVVVACVGLVLLHQVPQSLQVLGVVLVVAAGVGAERSGHRDPLEPHELTVPPGAA